MKLVPFVYSVGFYFGIIFVVYRYIVGMNFMSALVYSGAELMYVGCFALIYFVLDFFIDNV